jgi:hypothetical protein
MPCVANASEKWFRIGGEKPRFGPSRFCNAVQVRLSLGQLFPERMSEVLEVICTWIAEDARNLGIANSERRGQGGGYRHEDHRSLRRQALSSPAHRPRRRNRDRASRGARQTCVAARSCRQARRRLRTSIRYLHPRFSANPRRQEAGGAAAIPTIKASPRNSMIISPLVMAPCWRAPPPRSRYWRARPHHA